MPCHNSGRFLIESLASVRSQTFDLWELIVVDDCSDDNSIEILKDFSAKDPRIKIIQLVKNSGAAVARNAGIAKAKGRYIAFLDSDDIWLPHKLEYQLGFMQSNAVAFSYSSYTKMDEFGRRLGCVGAPEKLDYLDLLKVCSIGCLTAMYDSEMLGKVYMPISTKREDYATWLYILKKTDYAYGISDVLAQYRVYSTQSSAKKLKMAKENWYLYREIEKLGVMRSAYYFTHYALRGVLRTKFPRLARMLGVLK